MGRTAGPVETADSQPAAEELAAEWTVRLTSIGMGKTHKTRIRFIRLARRSCWGIFIEPQDGPLACPCGAAHPVTPEIRVAQENIARGLPATVAVVAGGRAWEVSRVYIAAHGLKTDELPALAGQYGFAEAAT